MDDSTTNTRSSNQGSGSGTSSSYSWLDDYQSGNYDSLPHDEIFTGYRSWSQSADQDDLYEATYRGYESLGQDQWGTAASDLYNHTQSRGVDLTDLELSSPDYQSWNAQDMARVTSRVYGYSEQDTQQQDKQESDSGGGIPKPIIGLALAGALAFAASKIMGGKSDKEDDGVEGFDLNTSTRTNYERDTISVDADLSTSDYTASGATGSDYMSDDMGTGMSSGTSGSDWSAGASMSDSTSGDDWSGSTSGSTMSGGTSGNDWSADSAGSTLSGGFSTGGGTSGTSWSGNTTGGDFADDMNDDASGGRQSGSSHNTTS